MRPVLRLLGNALLLLLRIAGFVLALAVVLPLALLAAINTAPGRSALADLITRATGGEVQVSGLAGALPWHPRAARIALRGADGKDWLVLSDIGATIDPAPLLHRRLTLAHLRIGAASVQAMPPAGKGGATTALPVSVRVAAFSLARLHLAAAVAGKPLDLTVAGTVALARDGAPRGALHITSQAAHLPGGIAIAGAVADLGLDRAGTVRLALDVNGAAAASWQAPGPVSLHLVTQMADPLAALQLKLDGPQTALAGHAGYGGGAAQVALAGTLAGASLHLSLAGAQENGGWVVQHGDFAWHGIALSGTASLPAGAAPQIDATLHIAALDTLSPLFAMLGQQAPAIPPGTLAVTAKGSADALGVTVNATASLSGGPARLAGAATLDASARSLRLSRLQADWRGASLALGAPADLSMAAIRLPAVDLAMKGAHARLAASGRIAPSLDLSVTLAAMPLAALAQFGGPALTGTLTAGAHVTGTTAAPNAALHFAVAGLAPAHLAAGALPPARLAGTAQVSRTAAAVHATLDAGASHLALAGRVPLGPGALALRVQGAAELAMLDPFLAGAGRSIAGRLRADLRLAGTLAAPVPSGTLALRGGSFLDYSSGIHLRAITADLTANGRRIDIAHVTAAAGAGSVALSGTVDLANPADPHLALTLHAVHASLPQTDLMTAVLGADLTLAGSPAQGLDLGGSVTVSRADIRVPARLPAEVATLHVTRPGQAAPAAAPNAFTGLPARIRLALTLRAPEQIDVRGRGLDVELGGTLRLTGTAAQPVSVGGFSLRRGRFSMAGHTLDFTSGRIGFDGASLTDPTLHLVATSTANGLIAQLTVTGTASAPRIALSSTPSLPPDEVLSQLLFHTSTSSLGPFEIAELAATLASLSGSAPGVASALSDPLSGVRNALGLDQLSLGSAANGNAPQIKAGRYLGRHIYAGVRQDTGTGGTEAEMRVDLTRRLSLRATAGTLDTATATAAGQGAVPQTGSGGSVGVIYKFNY